VTSPAEQPLPTRLAGALGDAYTIEGEIGRGGMGVVYRARDERLQRRVAIKVLPPELAFQQDIRERFTREAQTAARLSHPHIVPIHTVGEGLGLVYFVMGYVDGESVAARIRRRGKLPVDEVRRIMAETADALSAAHAVSIIHRDIKPDNILLEGPRGRVMVTDFGIAKALSASSGATLTGAGVAIGTPAFMSPEQAAGERDIDGRSDLYSLGIVSYQMLTGELPFNAPTVAGILMKQITEVAPGIKRVAMIFNPATAPGGGSYFLPFFETAARSFRVEPIIAPVHSDADIESVITALGREPKGGFVLQTDAFLFARRAPIIAVAAQNNVPAVYPWAPFPRDGGLLSYGTDLDDLWRRAAPYVDRILRGAMPKELPVQLPVKFFMALNVKTAKALGLTVPPSLFAIADEVIE
jgi:serine/threonine protein kinase